MLFKNALVLVWLFIFGLSTTSLHAQTSDFYTHYPSYNELQKKLQSIANQSEDLELKKLASSAGNQTVWILSAISNTKNPAIFVSANLSGIVPISSIGAVYLAQQLAKNPDLYTNYSWYIVPCGNPDAYINDLEKSTLPYNASIVNNDMDDQSNEDGPDDLNGDHILSQMRVHDPLGNFILHTKDPQLMVEAESESNAKDRYSVYAEGFDNDNDGAYNEDPAGGVNIAHTFPYRFNYQIKENGKWSGSETETFAILNFFSEHPEICMTLNIGTSDFLRTAFIKKPKSVDPKTYSIPSRYANYFGLSTAAKYTIPEMIKQMNEARPEEGVDEAYIFSMLNSGALKEPLSGDADAYKTFSDGYTKHLKNTNFPFQFIEAQSPQDGAFETWAYYHLGLPSLALRLWDIPLLPKDSAQTNKKTAALSRDEAFILYNDSLLHGAGFVNWTTVSHPDFGNVEVGGIKTHYIHNPVDSIIYKTIEPQIDWVATLPNYLPKLRVDSVIKTALGKNVYRIEAFVKNTGKIAAPLSIGSYTHRPAPIVFLLQSKEISFLEGKERTQIKHLNAGAVQKISYMIQSNASEINFTFDAKNVKTQSLTYKLK